jgi:uncharacterized protein
MQKQSDRRQRDFRIGVLADTHVPHRIAAMPARVFELLADSDVILHAGDLEDPAILTQLAAVAPVYAVRGNLHWQFSTGMHDQDLPHHLTLELAGTTIWMTHGHMHFANTVIDRVIHLGKKMTLNAINRQVIDRLAKVRPASTQVVIFGHTHKPCAIERDGVLYFNPGAVTGAATGKGVLAPPSVGILTVTPEGMVTHEWRVL